MALLVRAVVRRHMRETGRFVETDTLDGFPGRLNLAPGEALIGWYRNPQPWEQSFVVFTDKAIYAIENGSSVRIDMGDILDYEFPKSKTDVSGVRVLTRDGFRYVRVSGSFGPHGNQKDAFSFIQIVGKLAARNEREEAGKGGPTGRRRP